MERSKFQDDLEVLLSRCCIENASNTPDFILGMFLLSCLHSFNHALARSEEWYKRDIAQQGEGSPQSE